MGSFRLFMLLLSALFTKTRKGGEGPVMEICGLPPNDDPGDEDLSPHPADKDPSAGTPCRCARRAPTRDAVKVLEGWTPTCMGHAASVGDAASNPAQIG